MTEQDAPGTGLVGRIDSIERRLEALREELADVRAIVRA
jgi:hypothetical protein